MTDGRKSLLGALLVMALSAVPSAAQKTYDPGASDTEIKIGNINPYSGPASAYGMIGRTLDAYFRKVNAEGGINGRKITYLSYDDGYTPPRTLEQAKRLVESDQVLLIFQSLGTAQNAAIQRYLNGKKVPQLFVATGATRFADPRAFPWTMGWQPNYQIEAGVYAKYLREHHPRGKVAILYQNDDYGKDYIKGLKDGLAGKIPVVSEQSYEVTDATVNSQMISLHASGADVLFNVATPKHAAQAIRRAAEMRWSPAHLLNSVSTSVGGVLTPAGLDNARGLLSALYYKDPTNPAWQNDPDYKAWLAFMEKHFPDGDRTSNFSAYAYAVAHTLTQVLRQCGDDLTRENVMRQAANLKDLELPMLLPGIRINTSPTDYDPIDQMQMMRFSGERWELFGPLLTGDMGR